MDKPELLWNGYTIRTGPAFPLSTDSMCLAHFAPLPGRRRVVDFGSGAGTLGLLLCGRQESCTVTGIEISPEAHKAACRNIQSNALEERLFSVLGDIRNIPTLLPCGQFDLAVSNPPYFIRGHGFASTGALRQTARETDVCSLDALFDAAAWCLPTGGRFCLVHRPERLTDLLCAARSHNLEPKRLCFLRHRPDSAAKTLLLECRRGGKPGLHLEKDWVLYHMDGSPTPLMREIYHL